MDIYKSFSTDPQLESKGVWSPMGDADLLIGRSGNRAFSKKFSKLYEQNQRALDVKGDEADAIAEKIMCQSLAGTVLLGWKNVQFDGVEMEFSVENAEKLLMIKDFRAEVTKRSDEFENYKLVKEAELEKN